MKDNILTSASSQSTTVTQSNTNSDNDVNVITQRLISAVITTPPPPEEEFEVWCATWEVFQDQQRNTVTDCFSIQDECEAYEDSLERIINISIISECQLFDDVPVVARCLVNEEGTFLEVPCEELS